MLNIKQSQFSAYVHSYLIDFIVVLQTRANLQATLSALQMDYDNLNARFEEESEAASMLRQSYSKLQTDYQTMKVKLEKDLAAKTEEYEDLR